MEWYMAMVNRFFFFTSVWKVQMTGFLVHLTAVHYHWSEHIVAMVESFDVEIYRNLFPN